MSYSESNNQVTLTMSREDYNLLQLLLKIGYVGHGQDRLASGWEFMNRLNEGNPHYTPYQVPTK